MGIHRQTAATISGLVFAGTVALAVGPASPAAAASPATVHAMTAAPGQAAIGEPEPRCRWVCDAQRQRQEEEMLRGEQGALQAQEAVRARQRQLQEQEAAARARRLQEQETAGGG